LPWQVEKPITQQKYEKAVMKKMCTHASSLFVGFPEQFYKFIQEFKFLK
jgi:hypothetical protein